MPANAAYDLTFWRDEIERSVRAEEPRYTKAEENLRFYTGEPLDAMPEAEFVNVNVDFYETEQKTAQLFFESPELQFAPASGFEPMTSGILAFRKLVNVILGPDYIDALDTVLISLKRCSTTTGLGPTVIGYQPTIQSVPSEPTLVPGQVLGLSQPVPVPVHEMWFWDELSDKKFRKPADFTSTNFDKAPWLGMDFRIPLKSARQLFNLPPDFEGTSVRDDKVLGALDRNDDAGKMAYVDGTLVWYKASLFDDDEIHPEIYRRHVIVKGLDTFADKDDPAWRSPYQTKLANGRLRADSMIGNPIHIFSLRAVPDSANPPSDASMRRPLVKELCAFRSDMVVERGVNKPKFAYKASAFPPEAIAKVEAAVTAGALIPLPDDAFTGGLPNNFVLLAQGSTPRQTFLANDYITRDIAKTSGIDATGVGVNDPEGTETATKTAEMAQARNVRLDAERKRILRQYIKAVDGKIAPLVLRFCSDPQRVTELIGPESAQLYLQWRTQILELGDVRPKFTARPDSQIKLDAAAERRSWLQFYNFAAKDPMVNRAALLNKIVTLYGEDPQQFLAQPQESKPEPSLGWSFKGEDLNPMMPQFPIVLEALAQMGIQISPQAMAEAKDGALNQMLLQQAMPVAASGKTATRQLAPHGGLADKMGPLDKQSSEETGTRSGPKVAPPASAGVQ